MNRILRRPSLRTTVVAAIAAISLMIGLAHSGLGDGHMGEAAAMCVAAAAVTATGLAAAPRLGRILLQPPRPGSWGLPARAREYNFAGDARARGHPSVLQVFRR
jgi:hypothetical protein